MEIDGKKERKEEGREGKVRGREDKRGEGAGAFGRQGQQWRTAGKKEELAQSPLPGSGLCSHAQCIPRQTEGRPSQGSLGGPTAGGPAQESGEGCGQCGAAGSQINCFSSSKASGRDSAAGEGQLDSLSTPWGKGVASRTGIWSSLEMTPQPSWDSASESCCPGGMPR